MNRLGCVFGILLILLSLAVLAVMVVLPVMGSFRNDPNVLAIQSAINCPGGHRFESVDPNAEVLVGENLALATGYCISPTGQRIPITSEHQLALILITVVLFLIPLLAGLALGIMGFLGGKATALDSQPALTVPDRPDNVIYTQPKPVTTASTQASAQASPTTPSRPAPAPMPSAPEPASDLPPAASMPDAPTAPNPIPPAPMPSGPTAQSVRAAEKPPTQPLSRVDRLKQLLADYEQGLLTEEQFDRLYKSMNDDMA